MKTKPSLSFIFGAVVCGLCLIAGIMFLFAPIISQNIDYSGAIVSFPGFNAIFGGTATVTVEWSGEIEKAKWEGFRLNVMGLVTLILLIVGGGLTLLGGKIKSRHLTSFASLLLLVGTVFAFLEPTWFLNRNDGGMTPPIPKEYQEAIRLSVIGLIAGIVAAIGFVASVVETSIVKRSKKKVKEEE